MSEYFHDKQDSDQCRCFWGIKFSCGSESLTLTRPPEHFLTFSSALLDMAYFDDRAAAPHQLRSSGARWLRDVTHTPSSHPSSNQGFPKIPHISKNFPPNGGFLSQMSFFLQF